MNLPSRIITALVAAASALAFVILGALPASAVTAVGHGTGYIWAADHVSWIGSYQLGDGNMGFCMNVERPQPIGSDFYYVDSRATGRYSTDDSARLAFVAQYWGRSADPVTAAAAQLVTWMLTGMGGHDENYFAQRANGDMEPVLVTARHMIQIMNGPLGATRGVSASVSIALGGAASSVDSELLVDYLATGPIATDHNAFGGVMRLTGATFDDGSTTANVRNGVPTHIVPADDGSGQAVTASVEYRDLPFGGGARIGQNPDAVQDLVVSSPYPADATGTASTAGPSATMFRPQIQTRTSAPVAVPGDALTDAMTLGVHPESPSGDHWGSYAAAGGSIAPIPVTITSTLYGPMAARPKESAAAPADTPVVCTVELVVTSGPGVYDTAPCTVSAAGYYVWTDSIDPSRTDQAQGGDRLLGWQSAFGVADETSLLPATAVVATRAALSPGDVTATSSPCATDELTVTGLSTATGPVPVVSTLVGPLPEAPPPGETAPDWQKSPVAGRVTTDVTSDGTYTTPCVAVSRPGHYYFVVESQGSPLQADGSRLIAPFSDTRVYASESIALAPPGAILPGPAARPAAPDARLALTGGSWTREWLAFGLIALALPLGTVGVVRSARRRRV